MKQLFKYIKPYLWQIAILIGLTYLQVTTNLMLPDYMAKIINNGIIPEDMDAIYRNGSSMIIVAFASVIFSVIAGFLASKIATAIARDIRQGTFNRIESFSVNEFNKFSTSSLITRSTNDIQQIQMASIMLLRIALIAPFTAIAAMSKAINSAPSLNWIIALSIGILLTIITTLFIFGLPKFQALQKLVDKLNQVTRENLTGLRVIRAFNNEIKEEQKFDATNKELVKINLFVNRLMSMMQPVMFLLMNLALLAIVWFGAKQIDLGNLEIGDMLAFMQYATQVIFSFLMISIIFIMVPRASISAKRVAEVLSTNPSICDPIKAIQPDKNGRGRIEFKDVTFSYPGADLPVLTSINFLAEPGKTTAFIGSTGSGKSTLINLIPRFYDVSAGQVLIDGIDVRDLNLKDLYSQIGYVPQKGVLFSGTVKSNIIYGNKKASSGEIEKAAKIAQASEFIDKLSEKYDSTIAQGGTNISGGQKQRLSIARAIAVKPKIFIFDDSFSALDYKTDAKLRHALKNEIKNKTVLIVGQRISTIMNADKIIVLNEGKIVGQSTHLELMKTNQTYREIAYSQLSDKELKAIEKNNSETE